jgi:hypothetical protein
MFCRSLFVLFLLAIALSVVLRYIDYDYPFGIFWPLCFLLFFDILIMITPLVSFGHCVFCCSLIYWLWLPLWYLLAIVFSVVLWYIDYDYPFGIFKLFFMDWVSDCCLTLNEQFFIYIMTRTNCISMRWWWCELCTRITCWVGLL